MLKSPRSHGWRVTQIFRVDREHPSPSIPGGPGFPSDQNTGSDLRTNWAACHLSRCLGGQVATCCSDQILCTFQQVPPLRQGK